ncbi:hypothetical protein F2Q68_00029267 [Brassica cretica]|uniref:Uncharacterized protein n=1 Tax=Brassica cretica TaxID=69181 RepID=A0A8S9GBK8_BRACR|nr:hypothetical protein F2Q68_00029267 [Brassica cretica]
MDKIMRSMQGMPGAPGMKVYSREDIEKYKDNPGKFGNEDEDDDDDDADDKFPKNLGKVPKEKKSSKKEEWKKTITKELKKKGEVLKRHAQKVSNRVRRWWKRVGSSSSKKPKSGKFEL